MSEKKNLTEEELKNINGGAGITNTLNFTGATAKTGINMSGGNFESSSAKTMVQTTATPSSGKGLFAKLRFFFNKKAAKNVAGKNATVMVDNNRDMFA